MKSTERFSNRVENYVRYRPGYPGEVLETLRSARGLTPASVVADVGSGTGILTEQFLRNGNRVFAVEPNLEMRSAAERLLAGYAGFVSVDGTAEATGLADASVDFISAAQCLHWFDLQATRAEFLRILKPGGWVAVIWNDRRDASPFMRDYRSVLLRHAVDYQQVDHKRITPSVLASFFAGDFESRVFDNPQVFDWEGLRGRLLSSSYMPLESDGMIAELRDVFERHAVGGRVTFDHDTSLYYGTLAASAPPG